MEEPEKEIKYDKDDDYRFPVALLYKALWILKKFGHETFYQYCEGVDMPSQDIERVLNKYKYETDPKFRKEVKGILARIVKKLKGTDLETELEEIPF